ncbi:hypothetical protein ES695_05900 [Candidatus Atribacteria bacterium 1244-E10-H5-B2]|nr:MAG: hypothetical protein ES695_05900 [Candidatus Atribacteria bacterium 1244-E10-H5-B2]
MTNKKILTLISFLLLFSFLMVGCKTINQPPVITSSPVETATVGVDYTYNVVATDPNTGDVLTYSLDGEPTGMVINGTSGKITWTPTATGSVGFTVVVTDEGRLFDDQEVTVTVGEFVVELVGIEVDPETVTLCIPETKGLDETFTVTADYNDGSDKVVTSACVYGIDDTSVAIVSAGNITALKVGTATISISYTEEGITKGTTLAVIVEGTMTVRWLEDAVRFNPDGSVFNQWQNCPIPSEDQKVPGPYPAILILTGGEYHFDDVAFVYNYYPLPDLGGSVVIDETGQLSGHTTYTLYDLDTTNDFVGQVEIVIGGEINWEAVPEVSTPPEDYDSIMIGTYTQWKYVYGTEEEVIDSNKYPNAVPASEQGSDWWFVGKTIYTAHGGK